MKTDDKTKYVIIAAIFVMAIFAAVPLFTGNTPSVQGYSTRGECFDSDGGKDYFTSGYVIATMDGVDSGVDNFKDRCIGEKTLLENFCLDGTLKRIHHDCEYECEDGACLPSGCFDSDISNRYPNGRDYYQKGYVSFTYDNTGDAKEDWCLDGDTVQEWICNADGKRVDLTIDCPNGCHDGACQP